MDGITNKRTAMLPIIHECEHLPKAFETARLKRKKARAFFPLDVGLKAIASQAIGADPIFLTFNIPLRVALTLSLILAVFALTRALVGWREGCLAILTFVTLPMLGPIVGGPIDLSLLFFALFCLLLLKRASNANANIPVFTLLLIVTAASVVVHAIAPVTFIIMWALLWVANFGAVKTLGKWRKRALFYELVLVLG